MEFYIHGGANGCLGGDDIKPVIKVYPDFRVLRFRFQSWDGGTLEVVYFDHRPAVDEPVELL